MKITKSQLKEIIKESLEDRINPDLDDLEQAGFRPDPEEVGRLLAKKFPDLANGRVTQKIGKNDLMVFIADEYDTSEQTAMQVVEEMIEEGIIGMFTDFVNIISADFDEVNESIEKMVREEMMNVILEKDDRCTRIAKSKYDVWPSAYASGAVVRCRDGKIWKDVKEGDGEGLRKWFGRKGEKGSKGGWVDCNSPDGDGGYKACGREKGEKRSKYPACRPTPGACKEKGKGKSWGKKGAKKEGLSMDRQTLMEIINEELENVYYEYLAEGETLEEAEYQGRKVTLNKPTRGDVKKSKVYVKNAKGNVVKVNFGDPNMKIKKNIPARRKSFRARHNCDNPGPKWKARYWSCKAW